jgi:hypothetical protein
MRARTRNRAVSDVVGFVLIFSIIITGVGLVSVTGFDALSEFTNDQQVENSERGMESASATLDKLHRNGDTYRQFDLSLGGGTLWLNETEISLSSSSGIDLSGVSTTIQTNALEHRFDLSSGEASIVYEAGGLFRTQSATPRYDPTIQCEAGPDDDTTIVSLVELTASDQIRESGSYDTDVAIGPTSVPNESPVAAENEFVSFQADLVGQDRIVETGLSGEEIRIDVSQSAYPDQWGSYLDQNGWTDNGGGEYACGGETVLVRVSTIQLSLLERTTT